MIDLAAIPNCWRALVAEINGIGRIPDGTPRIRDVDAPCDAFQPRVSGTMEFGRCETDGHYICDECREIKIEEWRRRHDLCEECGAALPDPGTYKEHCPDGCY